MAKSPFFARIRAQVLQLTASVPSGKVCTHQSMGEYLDVMPRHVAYILSQLEDHEKVVYPWHRVVSSDASLGTPKQNPDGASQADLLRAEGLLVSGNQVVSTFAHVFVAAEHLRSGLERQKRPDNAPGASRGRRHDAMKMASPVRTRYAPLTEQDIEDLVPVLHHAPVFEFIGGLPTRDEFVIGLRRAIAGPPATHADELWINHGVRLLETGELIGRVEATVHHRLAEVAFLYSPAVWGQGYAAEGLHWLHQHLRGLGMASMLWATTHPQNQRSAALLRRAGYVQASTVDLPLLYSYDEGDLVFSRSLG